MVAVHPFFLAGTQNASARLPGGRFAISGTVGTWYNSRVNRKRVYAVHIAKVGFASMAEYARWKAGPDPAPAGEFFIFYRQDAAGRATVRQYPIRYARHYGLLDRLTDSYQYEYDPSRHTYKIEPFRPKFQRWHAGINPHTGRAE